MAFGATLFEADQDDDVRDFLGFFNSAFGLEDDKRTREYVVFLR